jgi:hypothetical protein
MSHTPTHTDATEAQRTALANIEAYILAQPIARQAWTRQQVRAWAVQELARRIIAKRWPPINVVEA